MADWTSGREADGNHTATLEAVPKWLVDGERAQCDRCWKFRPLQPWTFGEHCDLCARCWRKARNAATVRTWSRSSVRVATVHPQHGELHRGTITVVHQSAGWRMVWRVQDHDSYDLGKVVGDYVDAETRLLDATAWADQIDESNDKEH